MSRKLSVTPSNSCHLFLPFSDVAELQHTIDKKTKNSRVSNPKQPLKLAGLPSSRYTCLVFRVVYKVQYVPKDSSGKKLTRDFVLGR